MTINEFVRILRVNLWLLILGAILGAGAGYAYGMSKPTLYAASSSGYVVVGSATSTGDAVIGQSLAQQKAKSYVSLVNTRRVGETIQKAINSPLDPAAIAGSLSASVDDSGVLLEITAVSGDPHTAQALANAAIDATSQLANEIESGGAPNAADPVVRIRPLENALLPGAPFSPNPRRPTIFGAGIGAALALGFVLLRRLLDRRVRHQGDLEDLIETSVLGVLPKVDALGGERRGGDRPLGHAAEAMRQLRTNLRFIDVDHPPRSLVVTSPNPGEGKSTVASNLARVLAAAGQPTVLIDADLRRPMVSAVFDLDGSVGLTQVLTGDLRVDEVLQGTQVPNLRVMTAGRIPPNPAELLGSRRMREVLSELTADNFVILDAPPLLPVTDAGLLTATCDGCLLVIRTGKTYKEQVEVSAKVLRQVNGRLFGAVMNMAPPKQIGSVIYGYGYGHGSYESSYSGAYESREPFEPLRPESRRETRAGSRTRRAARKTDSTAGSESGAGLGSARTGSEPNPLSPGRAEPSEPPAARR